MVWKNRHFWLLLALSFIFFFSGVNLSLAQDDTKGGAEEKSGENKKDKENEKDKKDKNNVDKIGNRRVAHRSIISLEKEVEIGKQIATEIDKSARFIKDDSVQEYVNRVAQNIARNSDLKIPLSVKVLDSPEINALALPGGFLYVNSGLILATDEEAQAASVLAHEIAHVAARHWASAMTKAQILQYALTPLIFTPIGYGTYILIMEGLQYGVPLAFLKFSRSAEIEADFLGLQYLYKTGYDPESYAVVFQKIIDEERKRPGSVPKIFMSHPPPADRIQHANEEIKTILPPKDMYLISTSEFEEIKARLQVIATPKKKDKKEGPTLDKQEPKKEGQKGGETDKDEDRPPILKRRD